MSVVMDISRVEGISMVGKNYQASESSVLTRQVFRARISSSGQVTIPVEVRKKLGVEKNDAVEFVVGEDEILMKRPRTWDEYFEEQEKWVEEEKKRSPAFAERLKKDAGKTANELRDEWMSSPEGIKYYKEKYGI
ncbi:AbrB/MazE/SpoVT family DNA-binding domain-containing protein [Candidatus Saccharibacteria bacterium]|nr:AbrB/MazE/SpoVT family DNA-binding domain-containing protein [Candidatus Saccharibacteria bacterium]